MSAKTIGKKELYLLGKIVYHRRPDMAKEFLPQIPGKGRLSDFTKMPILFQSYCKNAEINPDEYRGHIGKMDKVDTRRVFVSTMLHVFIPEVYSHPLDSPIIPFGFNKQLCETIGIGKGPVSRLIREVIIQERAYDDYKLKVDLALTMLNCNL
jgi:hypothetical protein